MTPKELYDWAIEHGCEDYDIKIDYMFNIYLVWQTPQMSNLLAYQQEQRK